MKYFIAHLLSGDVYQYHLGLTQELSERYRIAPLHARVDPHITIKNFEANDYEIGQVESKVAEFVTRFEPMHFTVEGFGKFGHKTIYLDVVKSREATLFARECIYELNAFSWMRPVKHEGEKLHASIARYLRYRQSRKIWRRLKREETPRFRSVLDTVTILQKPGKRWEVYREFPIGMPVQQSVSSAHSFDGPLIAPA